MVFGLSMLASGSPLDHVVQHPHVQTEMNLGPLTPDGKLTIFSDHIAMLMLAGVLLILFVPSAVRKRRGTSDVDSLIPTGFANFFETVCQYLRKEVAEPALGEHTDRFIKYIWSVFFFILTVNLLGLIPIGAVTPLLFGAHIGGTATANIFVTGMLAVLTMAMMIINGLRLGGVHYLAHFCPGPLWLAPLMVLVELVGMVAKIFALAVRLFANMMAGHILLAVLLSFILMAGQNLGAGGGVAIAIPVIIGGVAINLLEIFVAFLQAFIFTFLTTLFIGMSVTVHHEHEEHGHGVEHEHTHA